MKQKWKVEKVESPDDVVIMMDGDEIANLLGLDLLRSPQYLSICQNYKSFPFPFFKALYCYFLYFAFSRHLAHHIDRAKKAELGCR